MMEGLKIDDLDIREKIASFDRAYANFLTPVQAQFLRLVLMRYRQYSDNEYYLYLTLLYAHVYFKVIDIEDPVIGEIERKYLKDFSLAFHREMQGDADGFIESMLELDEDLFLLKIIIKYTALLTEEQYGGFIPVLPNYYAALGWLIPLLSYKNYQKISGVLQDIYFQKLYPEEYEWTKATHHREIETAEVMENFLVDFTNDIMVVMERLGIFGVVRLRKKSYFSIYNKIIRKKSAEIYDFMGARVILKDMHDLELFTREFEKRFVIGSKKDYISYPKDNGYKWIHYAFLYTFKNHETEMELQVRTSQMDQETYSVDHISHFTYSCEEEKWHPIFREVHQGMELVKKYISKMDT